MGIPGNAFILYISAVKGVSDLETNMGYYLFCITRKKFARFFSAVNMTQIMYLAFKETTWFYSKFVYRSAFLCKPVPPHSQPIQICCTMITNMPTELPYGHLYVI